MENGHPTTRGKRERRAPEGLWVRILLLGVLLLAANTWAAHHLGQERLQLWLANGPLLLTAIVGFFSRVLKKEKSSLKEWLRGCLFFCLQTPVLTVLYGLFLVASLFVSSVTVISADAAEATLAPEGTEREAASEAGVSVPEGVLRLVRFTTPFGRAYHLDVDGYARHSFDLYPWVGTKVRIPRDLQVLPSVVIRVPFDEINLLDRGRIKVVSGPTELVNVPTRRDQGSVMVGPFQGVPSTFMDKWMMELLALGVGGEPLYSCLLYWQRPVRADSSIPLEPGMELEAIFFIAEDKPLARARFWMGTDDIQDVMLLKEKEP